MPNPRVSGASARLPFPGGHRAGALKKDQNTLTLAMGSREQEKGPGVVSTEAFAG